MFIGCLNVGLKDAHEILTGSPFSCKHALTHINVMSQKNSFTDENIVNICCKRYLKQDFFTWV
ncbi:ATP-dependent helicase HrpA domain protein [Vibrio parahaemolyticus]|nr:ATP-dependent helicase HrpA domain protein [Vibrio parahaemolyticus]AYF19537.1 ATP-dependent helicase HrpA domain protein [Vibrio parahaemolyticus]